MCEGVSAPPLEKCPHSINNNEGKWNHFWLRECGLLLVFYWEGFVSPNGGIVLNGGGPCWQVFWFSFSSALSLLEGCWPHPAVPWPPRSDCEGDILRRKLVAGNCRTEPVEVLMWRWDPFQRCCKEYSLLSFIWESEYLKGNTPSCLLISVLLSVRNGFGCSTITVDRGRHGLFFSNLKEVWRLTIQAVYGGARA